MITVAAFIERALYDPEHGYYARAAQRSGRAGDFFTSVDVGPLFGELLELQIEEMWRLLGSPNAFDLVEAGAGNGRLSTDILRAARSRHPLLYQSIRLNLVEASAAARSVQAATLADSADRLASSTTSLPDSFEGVVVANELLDAMPVHQVMMTADGLREVYVTDGVQPATVLGPLSTPMLEQYFDALGVALEPGWTAEVNLNAVSWIRDAARRLKRGFMVLIDYGHEARELYSVAHSAGTLTSFRAHHSTGAEAATPAWLQNRGQQDITAHVDFTSVRAAAEAEGMTTLAFLDQTYFLLGLLQSNQQSAINPRSEISNPQLRTLILPGGLGSTMKVLLLGKEVGLPALSGCSFSTRAT